MSPPAFLRFLNTYKEQLLLTALQETVLSVPDVSCEHCVHAIHGALKDVPGIETVNTDIPTKTVLLRYNPNLVTMAKVEEVLDDIGYTVAQ